MAETFEEMVREKIVEQFDRAANAEGINHKELRLHVWASMDYDGNLSISYDASVGKYSSESKASSDSLAKSVSECMRRAGWDEANKPMALIGSAKTIDAD